MTAPDWSGKPVIGIVNTGATSTPATRICGAREDVKRGVLQGGGFPIELTAMSSPSPREALACCIAILAMETEELFAQPSVDGAVLLGGCDKPRPADHGRDQHGGFRSCAGPARCCAATGAAKRSARVGTRGILGDEKRAATSPKRLERDRRRHLALPTAPHGDGHGRHHDGDTEALGSRCRARRRSRRPTPAMRACARRRRRIVDMVWRTFVPARILSPASFDNAIRSTWR